MRATTRRSLLCSVWAVAVGLWAALPLAAGETPEAEVNCPDVVIVIGDDIGYSDFGCYGGEIETPNIDRLAAGGLRFTQYHTENMCAPTRATLLTGQYPWRNGWCNHWDVPRWGAGCHFDWKQDRKSVV